MERFISCFSATDGRYSYTHLNQGHHIKDHNNSLSNLVDLAKQKVAVTAGFTIIVN